MIELVFNENAAQALKRIKERNDSALKVGDIYVLNLFLDVGDISDVTPYDISSGKNSYQRCTALLNETGVLLRK